MIGGQEVPAEDLIGQSQVALKDTGHVSTEVFTPSELLQHLHGHHEDLTQAVLLEWTRDEHVGDCSKSDEGRGS